MPKLTLNNREVVFNKGETILEVAWREGIKIPVFCHHPKLKPEASCRMCLVQVEQRGRKGLLPACATPAAEGMVIATDTEEVKKNVRARTLEFLLANHPLECPVCDAGGECDLQNLTYKHGDTVSLYEFPKREQPRYDVGPFLRLYPNRCVNCTRCVRLYQGFFGETDWDRWERGWEIIVGPGRDKLLDSVFAGNMADVCPVGAITPGDYTFSSRPWENKITPSVSPEDSLASPILLVTRKTGRENRGPITEGGRRAEEHRILKIHAADAEGYPGWISDRDRFSHEYIQKNRLENALARSKGESHEIPVDQAVKLMFQVLKTSWRRSPHGIAVLSGARGANEASYLATKLFREVFEVKAMDFRGPDHSFDPDPVEEALGYSGSNASLSLLPDSDLIFTFGEEFRERHPGVGLWLIEAEKAGARIVNASPWMDRHSRRWEHISYHPEQQTQLALSVLAGVAKAKGIKVDGLNADPHPIGEELAKAKKPFILFPDNIDKDAQRALAHAVGLVDARFVLLRSQPNGQGFYDTGFVPQDGQTTDKILQRAATGEIEVLVLWDIDPLLEWPNRSLVEEALSKAGFVIYMGSFADDPSLAYADLALPIALPFESTGSRTSTDGLVVWHEAALSPPGQALPAGVVFAKLLDAANRGGYRTLMDATRAYLSNTEVYNQVSLPPEVENRPYPGELASLNKFKQKRLFKRASYKHEAAKMSFGEVKQQDQAQDGFLLVAAPELYKSSYYAHRCSIFSPYIKLNTVEINPQDAQGLGVSDGDKVRLSADGQSVVLSAFLSQRTPEGVLRFSPVYADAPVNLLLKSNGRARVQVQKEAGK